jgi:hypothetical protein
LAYGTYNEYIIFPILDFIKREIEKLKNQQTSVLIGGASLPAISSQIQNYQDTMKYLESPEYDLELQRNDILNPDILTDIVINYSEQVKLFVKLIREDGKLQNVISSVMVKDSTSQEVYLNPYDMSFSDFGIYLRCLVELNYYNDLVSLGGGVSSEISNRMTELFSQKQNLENKYGLSFDSLLSYSELISYYPIKFTTELIQGSSLVSVKEITDDGLQSEVKFVLLLKIQITLNYTDGRLNGVSSKIITGAV